MQVPQHHAQFVSLTMQLALRGHVCKIHTRSHAPVSCSLANFSNILTGVERAMSGGGDGDGSSGAGSGEGAHQVNEGEGVFTSEEPAA